MKVIARIDISTPAGRKILRQLATNKTVKIEYPDPDLISGQKTYSVEEVFDECIGILSNHYQVDCKEIWKTQNNHIRASKS